MSPRGCELPQSADHEQSEGDDQAAGADPVVKVPAPLLRHPVAGKIGWRPEFGAVVNGDGADKREEDGGELDGEGDGREMSGENAEVFKGQKQEQVEQRGSGHPEGHDLAEEPGEGGADGNVDVEGQAVQGGMTEGGHVQLTAAHQSQNDDC
jgi:hypothetical protein